MSTEPYRDLRELGDRGRRLAARLTLMTHGLASDTLGGLHLGVIIEDP